MCLNAFANTYLPFWGHSDELCSGMINPASKANRILKSGTFQPDYGRMPLKVSQLVRITTLPFQTVKAGVQIRLNPGQKAGRISDGSLTIGGVAGQNPAITTKQQTVEMPMKSKIAAPAAQIANDGRAGGIRTHDPLPPRQVRYQTALQPAP
jgi:hypothetical protein